MREKKLRRGGEAAADVIGESVRSRRRRTMESEAFARQLRRGNGERLIHRPAIVADRFRDRWPWQAICKPGGVGRGQRRQMGQSMTVLIVDGDEQIRILLHKALLDRAVLCKSAASAG